MLQIRSSFRPTLVGSLVVLRLLMGCGGLTPTRGDAATSDVTAQDVRDSGGPTDAPTTFDTAMAVDAQHATDATHETDATHATDAATTCGAGDTVYVSMGPHWNYMDQSEWPMLMNSMCGGMTQTPINIPVTTTPETTGLTFNNYGNVPLRLVHNGHTLQVNVTTRFAVGDPSVTYNGTAYYLLQFHAHTTSEHTVRGTSFPMEVHFVHASNNTPTAQLLVVGALFSMGADNPVIETVLAENPGQSCRRERLTTSVNLGAMLPSDRSHYHYNPGSLTTPLCTEGLNWFVLSTPLTVGTTQVSRFAATVHGSNNRQIQLLGTRTVYQYTQPAM